MACDPNELANLARCWSSCGADSLAVKTFLLCNWAFNVTCTAPQAPTDLTVGATTSSTISISWTQPLSIPPVPVDHYVVKWGTTSGVYTDSATVAGGTFTYNITGLAESTTYFIVVQAIGTDGCASANSAELQAATEANINLLTGIGAYWKLDEGSNVTRVDATGNGEDLTDVSSGVLAVPSKINNGIRISAASTQQLRHVDDAILGIGAGVSFTITCWETGQTHDAVLVAKWDTSAPASQDYRLYIGNNGNFGDGFIWFSVKNLAGSEVQLVSNLQTTNSLRFVAAGYDDALQQIWIQIDNGVRLVKSCVGVRRTGVAFTVGNYVNNSTNGFDSMDEVGFWRRSLTSTEISKLYNAGSGIQYPFTGATAGTVSKVLTEYTTSWWQTVYNNNGDPSNNPASIGPGGGPTSAELSSLDTLYTGINANAGLLAKMQAINPLLPHNIAYAMWPFIGVNGALPTAPWTNHNFGAGGDLTINGLQGNGTTKYIDTGFQGTSFASDNSVGLFVYVYTLTPGGLYDIGYFNNAGSQMCALRFENGSGQANTFLLNNVAGQGLLTAGNPGGGFLSGQRSASNVLNLFYGSSVGGHVQLAATGTGAPTGTRQARNIYVGAGFAYEGGVPFGFTTNTYSVAGFTDGLTTAEDAALYNAIQAYLVERGGGSR